jgi:lycopene cyclase domain-containing protein
MLAFTVIGSFWLEIALKIRVLARIKRLFFSIFPVALLFISWDIFAVRREHWKFDTSQILGIYGPFNIPLEEFLFFLIIPIAGIMTLEAVRTVKKNWIVGDFEK